jgi:hypothetical protein
VNGTGEHGSSSERPSGHAPGWPFQFSGHAQYEAEKAPNRRRCPDHLVYDPGGVCSSCIFWALSSGRGEHCPPALAQRPLRHDSAQRTGGATEPPTGGVPFCGPPPSKKRRFGHDGPRTRLEHSRNRSARPLAMLRLEYFRQKLTRRLPTSDRRCSAKCFRRPLSSADVQKARASPVLAARRSGA